MKIKKYFFGLALSSFLLSGCGGSVDGTSGTPSRQKQTYTDGTFVISEEGDIAPVDQSISGNVVIPEKVENITVKKIPDNAFAGCTKMTAITIPSSVEYIGKSSFNGCNRLVEMTIPYVGNKIDGRRGEGIFGTIFGTKSYTGGVKVTQYLSDYWTDDVDYYVPGTLKKINVTAADGLSYGAFYGINMVEEIHLNSSMLTAEKHAFKNCSSLKEIDISMFNDIPTSMFVNCSALKSVKLSDELKTIGNYAFEGCSSLSKINSEEEGTFNLPSSLTSIGYSFSNCISIKKLITPFVGGAPSGRGTLLNMGYIFDNVKYEGSTEVTQYFGSGWDNKWSWYVPNSLKEIVVTNATVVGYGAFQNFTMLESLKINSGAQSNVADKAFDNCVEPTWF